MAESPALLNAYSAVQREFTGRGSLTPAEQQLVLLTVSYEKGCRYCMAGHSGLAQAAGLEPRYLEALRSGLPLTDPRLEALRAFATAMVRDRGLVSHVAGRRAWQHPEGRRELAGAPGQMRSKTGPSGPSFTGRS